MPRDAAAAVYERYMQATLSGLSKADLARLIETHRQNPFGPHPDELARVLNVFRAADTQGKCVIVRLPDEEGWRLAKVTGRRAEGSVAVEEIVHGSVEEAEHAAFVLRARDEAQKNLYVMSHRFGAAGRPAFVIPAIAAVADRGIAATAYYGILQREIRRAVQERSEIE